MEQIEYNAHGKQSLIDKMKFAKILYLADVLEDISIEFGQRMHSHHDICERIDGIVKDLRDTMNDRPNPMLEQQKLEIKRLEKMHKADMMMVPLDHQEEYEKKVIQEIVFVPIDDAIKLMEQVQDDGVGLLIKQRELPILKLAKEYIDEHPINKWWWL